MENKIDIKYSIIIPTLNHARKLKKCLNHITKLSFEPDLFEVLVIDNGSSDNTKEVSLSYKEIIKNFNLIKCDAPGLMAARHKGFDESKGEILCYIDDDSLVTKDWLKGIEESFYDEEVVLVGGPSIPEYEIEPPEWIEYFWGKIKIGKYNGFLSLIDFGEEEHYISPMYVYGCNYAIRKKTLLEFEGTHPDYLPEKYIYYQGDGESGLAKKIEQSNYRAKYHPKVRIRHLIPESRLTVEYFCWRRYFNGVHCSYTKIRSLHGKYKEVKKNIFIRIYYKIKNLIQTIFKRKNYSYRNEPEKIKQIREKIQNSFESGYNDHKEEFKKNPLLHEWVLRENYLGKNGILPETD